MSLHEYRILDYPPDESQILQVVLCINTVVIGVETDYSRGRALEERA